MIELQPVADDRERYLPLLLEADESEQVVRSYIDQGELLAVRKDGRDIGVVLLLPEGEAIEIKNIAIAEEFRSQGIGSTVIAQVVERARASGAKKLVVGTADSSLDAIRFYERAGFIRAGVRQGFFDSYPEPIWENGIRARDMLMFELDI